MLSKKQVKRVCYELINNRYPGYYLLMDRINNETYASLWGKNEQRVEIAMSRRQTVPVKAYVANYQIHK